MPVSVPTEAEFNAVAGTLVAMDGDIADLQVRVAALEATAVTPPPDPIINPPPGNGWTGDRDGIQAVRAGDLVDTLGFNVYPVNGQDGGSPTELAGQINYIIGDTGCRPMLRTFTWDGSNAFAGPLQDLIDRTGCFIAPAADHYGEGWRVGGVINLMNAINARHFKFVEGINEPNMPDFGMLTPQQVLGEQQRLYEEAKARGIRVVGPSVLYNTQDQANWWGPLLPQLLDACDDIAVHLYPNHGRYTGHNMLHDWTNTAPLDNRDWAMTETQPACWNNAYECQHFEELCGYHFLIALIQSCATGKCRAFNWWTMNDYPGTFRVPVGLFQNSAATPHGYTKQIKAFLSLLADIGEDRLTFATRKLQVSATAGILMGTPMETSQGEFWVPCFKDSDTMTEAPTVETLRFGSECALIENYPVASRTQWSEMPEPLDVWRNTTSAEFNLGPELRLLRVCK